MAKGAYIGVENFTKRALPSGYTQVEYIKSTGTQYIDTEVIAKSGIDIEAVLSWSNISGDTTFIGARTGDVRFNPIHYYNGISYGYSSFVQGSKTVVESEVHTVNSHMYAGSQTITVDGEVCTENADANSYDTSIAMYIFACNKDGTAAYFSQNRLYRLKISVDGTLVRDFVPCTNSSGTAGMYDIVNDVFYTNAGSGTFAVGKTYTSVARKVKKGYVGVETEVPIYEESVSTVNITASNISDMFKVTNGSYYFVGSGGTFTTNNGGVQNGTATTKLTAKYDMDVSFNYSYSSEEKYDKFTLKVAGTTVEDAVSGSTTSKSYSGKLTAGQTIEFTYAKDSSKDSNDDECTFSNMVVTATVKTQSGSEIKSLARKIKKAYIGIGGVARPCWSGGELAYYGTITPLSKSRSELVATSVGNYALFGGGWDYNGVKHQVDAYDKSHTRSNPTNFGETNGVNRLAATTVGNYALFGGGSNNSTIVSRVHAYNTSLTKSTTSLSESRKSLAAASVGNYAIFGGGSNSQNIEFYRIVDAFNADLTKSIPTQLASERDDLSATSVGNYALFGGGYGSRGNGGIYYTTVDAYDTSLTHSTPSELEYGRRYMASTTVGNYALFGGGKMYDGWTPSLEAYDKSLTRIASADLSLARESLTATTVGDYAIFAGGRDGNSEHNTVDVYDASLVRTIGTPLSVARTDLASTSLGDYALFGGGGVAGTTTKHNTVEVYVVN